VEKMKKFYIGNLEELNEEEKRTNKASYKRVIERYINDLVLCNKLPEIDDTIFDTVDIYDEENDSYLDIYQYFLCNIDEYTKEILESYGLIIGYSELLECDVLMVDHWGTSWDYVMTDAEITTNFNEV
jgi:hypothetical protein